MAAKRKSASRSKIDRLRQQTAKAGRLEPPAKNTAGRATTGKQSIDQGPARILSTPFPEPPAGQVESSVAQPSQTSAKKPWYRRLISFFSGKRKS